MTPRRDPPEIFAGRYEIQHEVGRGNQAVVHRALDRETGETVALKRWNGAAPPSVAADLLVDARTIARLAGPGIVAYRSVGKIGDSLFLAMEWVPGGRLADRLLRGPLTLQEALDASKSVARGLARLHRAGLSHRNLKPANVLLPEGAVWRAKISDPWIDVKEPVEARFDHDQFAARIGYLSPQTMRSGAGAAGPRDDVYSLGAILFRCLTGHMPYPEHDRPDISTAIPESRAPRELLQLAPNLPPDLADLVDRMLSPDPDKRPADAVEPCLLLHDVARRLGSYETITLADLAPDTADIPPHFEVKEAPEPAPDPSNEPEIEVDPEALRGPFVLLDPPLDGDPVTVRPTEPRYHSGDVIAGRFEIEEVVGLGETGVVYKARDNLARDTVALRIVDGAATRREIKHFLGDCAKHAQRYHPRIVRVLHRGTVVGRLFVAMDWIAGETLAQRLAREPLTMREAVTVIRGLVEALELVHTMGLVQGNLRPHKIFLRNRNPEWVKLADLAVWRETPHLPEIPLDELVYVAPEVVRTARPSWRADLYSLGAIAYRLLTGVPPFEAADAAELATKRWAPAPPLAELRPDAAPELCRLVDGLLEKNPSRRPHSAVVVAGSLPPAMDLGWAADRPPFDRVYSDQGRRTVVLPERVPVDPLLDARLQDFLTAELGRRCDSPQALSRLSDIAHVRAGAAGDSPGCALCGRGVTSAAAIIEVRNGGYFPLEHEDRARARPPALCSNCLSAPHEAVDAAVQRTLESYEGDDLWPIAALGPTRKEVREAMEVLYTRAVPRVGQGTCLTCGATGRAVLGRDGAMCPACLSVARGVYEVWVADAPNRRDARLHRLLDDVYRAAVEKVRGRPLRDPAEAVYRLRNRGPFAGASIAKDGMRDLRGQTSPPQRMIDGMADDFAEILLDDIAEAMRQADGSVPSRVSIGDWEIPALLGEFRSRFRSSRAADERLRIALAVLDEAERRGFVLYQASTIETIGG